MKEKCLKTILSHLPGRLRAPLSRAVPFFESEAQEIIFRAGRPSVIECGATRYYLTENGVLTAFRQEQDLLITTISDIREILKSICEYSVYARQNELNSGFITIENGVRVGVCGTAVTGENGIVNIKDITTLSFRVTAEYRGIAKPFLDLIDPLGGVLLCGPPCSGKTTMIRDMARLLSEKHKVSIIDERNEIAATVNGMHSFDIGLCDILVYMKKSDGVIHALRSLSPDIIVCDELGNAHDAELLLEAMRCGTAFIATVHAQSIDDLRCRRATAAILDSGAFRYVAILSDRSSAGRIETVYELRGACA